MDLGSHLRVTREQRGLTLEDVCARTKIPRQLLADLEMNDIARWPKQRIYQVGFLRAYAAEVGLNAEQVVARFVASCPERCVEVSVTKPEDGPAARVPRRLLVGGAAVVACLFVTSFVAVLVPNHARVALPEPVPYAPSTVQLEPRYTTTVTATAGSPSLDAPGDPEEALADSEIEGELRIDSNPGDAWVVVNGIGRGRTPVRIQYLPAGSYTIRLVRDGYRSSEERVTLSSERPVRSLRIGLHELPR